MRARTVSLPLFVRPVRSDSARGVSTPCASAPSSGHGARTVASFPLAGVPSAQQPTDRDCRDFASQAAAHAFPTERVYGDIDHAGLRLITCGGEFDRAARSYRENVVVYAGLVGSSAGLTGCVIGALGTCDPYPGLMSPVRRSGSASSAKRPRGRPAPVDADPVSLDHLVAPAGRRLALRQAVDCGCPRRPCSGGRGKDRGSGCTRRSTCSPATGSPTRPGSARRGCGPARARWCPARRRPTGTACWTGRRGRRAHGPAREVPAVPGRVRVRRRDLQRPTSSAPRPVAHRRAADRPGDGGGASRRLGLPRPRAAAPRPVPDRYRAYCRNIGRHGSSAAGRLLVAAADRADSAAERLLVRLLRDAGISGWVLGHPFGPWRIDLAFPRRRSRSRSTDGPGTSTPNASRPTAASRTPWSGPGGIRCGSPGTTSTAGRARSSARSARPWLRLPETGPFRPADRRVGDMGPVYGAPVPGSSIDVAQRQAGRRCCGMCRGVAASVCAGLSGDPPVQGGGDLRSRDRLGAVGRRRLRRDAPLHGNGGAVRGQVVVAVPGSRAQVGPQAARAQALQLAGGGLGGLARRVDHLAVGAGARPQVHDTRLLGPAGRAEGRPPAAGDAGVAENDVAAPFVPDPVRHLLGHRDTAPEDRSLVVRVGRTRRPVSHVVPPRGRYRPSSTR